LIDSGEVLLYQSANDSSQPTKSSDIARATHYLKAAYQVPSLASRSVLCGYGVQR
jgi:hypothetical protein